LPFGRIAHIKKEKEPKKGWRYFVPHVKSKKRGQRYPNNVYQTAFLVVGSPTFGMFQIPLEIQI
jgi:hypothetical protein